jgi:lipid-binding SYLF domain-containing protein
VTKLRAFFLAMALVAASAVAPVSAQAATAQEINNDSSQALQKLYKINPLAEKLSHSAKAILVFPNIIKAGFIFGGSYGEGQLIKDGSIAGYYNSISGSWGLQAGGQSYQYVLFLMTDKAVNYLRKSEGWEIGVGPTVVMVDEGVAKNLSTSTLKDDAYAFIFGQQGLMAGVSIEGSKITRISR